MCFRSYWIFEFSNFQSYADRACTPHTVSDQILEVGMRLNSGTHSPSGRTGEGPAAPCQWSHGCGCSRDTLPAPAPQTTGTHPLCSTGAPLVRGRGGRVKGRERRKGKEGGGEGVGRWRGDGERGRDEEEKRKIKYHAFVQTLGISSLIPIAKTKFR